MTRLQQVSLVLGCALVLWLEAPRAWHVLAGDLERAALAASVRTDLELASPPMRAPTELASAALPAWPVPLWPPRPELAAQADPAPR